MTMSVKWIAHLRGINLRDGMCSNALRQLAAIRRSSALRGFDALDRFANISAKTLVLIGDRDVMVPPWHSQQLAEGIKGARLEVIKGGGHAMYLDMAGQFNDAVVGFLNED